MELNNHTLKSGLIILFITAWSINISLHIPSFNRTHFKGDEMVYMSLSHSMGWDLSNYTVANDKRFSKWGHAIYNQPLFHHGPVLPYVLKIGTLIHKPITAALLFENLSMGLLFIHILVLYRRLSLSPAAQIAGFFMVAFAPLLLFSTTRIHHDALAGIYIACAFIAYIEALEKKSLSWSLWSGFLFVVALNLRLTGIISLPLIVLCQLYYLYFPHPGQAGSPPGYRTFRENVFKLEHWKVFAIVALLVATLGMQHFYRLLAAYGSIFPSVYDQPDPTSSWVQLIQTRTRGKNFINLILLIPLFIVFFLPQTWNTIRNGLVSRDWGAFCAISTLYLLLVLFVFSYEEMRFFAAATPMLYSCFPWILVRAKPGLTPFYLCLIAVSLSLMLMAGYREVIVRPNQVFQIVPAIDDLVPPLRKYW